MISYSTPIFSLPPEVLTLTFSIVLNETERSFALKILSHVCHDWRATILDCASLWASALDFRAMDSDPAWIAEILRRSKRAPLSAKFRNGPYIPLSILDHSARFERLHIILQDVHETSTLFEWPNAGSELPLLKSFHLNFDSENIESLHRVVFPGHVPFLRTVSLRSSFTDFWNPSFVNLVNLRVDNPAGPLTGTLPSSYGWAVIIGGMKGLRRLFLHNAICGTELRTTKVSLPVLSSINLSGPMRSCNDLLSYLTLPSTCSIYLDFPNQYTFQPADISQLQNELERHLALWPTEALLAIQFYFDGDAEDGVLEISNLFVSPSPSSPSPPKLPSFTLTMDWTEIDHELTVIFPILAPFGRRAKVLAFPATRDFEDSGYAAPWFPAIHALRNVRADDLRGLCDNLSRGVIDLPALHTLHISFGCFSTTWERNILLKYLRGRHKCGAPISRVEFGRRGVDGLQALLAGNGLGCFDGLEVVLRVVDDYKNCDQDVWLDCDDVESDYDDVESDYDDVESD